MTLHRPVPIQPDHHEQKRNRAPTTQRTLCCQPWRCHRTLCPLRALMIAPTQLFCRLWPPCAHPRRGASYRSKATTSPSSPITTPRSARPRHPPHSALAAQLRGWLQPPQDRLRRLLGLKTLSAPGPQALRRNPRPPASKAFSIGLVLGRLARTPVVFDFQGSLTEEMIDHQFLRHGQRRSQATALLETWIDRTAPVVFTSSTHAAELLDGGVRLQAPTDHCPARLRQHRRFPPRRRFPARRVGRASASLGIPPDAKVIVYLGLLARYQGASIPYWKRLGSILARHDNVYLC